MLHLLLFSDLVIIVTPSAASDSCASGSNVLDHAQLKVSKVLLSKIWIEAGIQSAAAAENSSFALCTPDWKVVLRSATPEGTRTWIRHFDTSML